MLLSIIIVNYNVKYFLEYCLYSVEKAMAAMEGEIIVFDNNSSDGSKDFFYNKFPKVRFIWNNENEGFAKANNKALLQASGDYILFLNPDTIVPEDCFEKCIAFIQSKKIDIACGVKMIDGSGKFLKESKRAFPSPITSLYKLSGLARMFPRSKIFSKYHLGFLDENISHEADVLAGAFMLIPKKILELVGNFDENFFMYGEDIDLSYRIQKAGLKNFYFAETTIIHFKGESTKKESLNYVKIFYKAMSIFVKKHYGEARAGLFNFFIQNAIFARARLSVIAKFFRANFSSNRISKTVTTNETIIAGTREDLNALKSLLHIAGRKEKIVGRISPLDTAETGTLGSFNELTKILKTYSVKEIIFCEGHLSFKQIIEELTHIKPDMHVNFFSKNLHAVIGSSDQNKAGAYISTRND